MALSHKRRTWHEVGTVSSRRVGHGTTVTSISPRYDLRLLEALRRLDDGKLPMAEVCRRLGAVADELGLMRPSYVHVRRLILAQRDERDAIRTVVDDLAGRLLTGRYVDLYEAVQRLRDARLPRRFS